MHATYFFRVTFLTLILLASFQLHAAGESYDVCTDLNGFVWSDEGDGVFGDGGTWVGIILPPGTIPEIEGAGESCDEFLGQRIGTYFGVARWTIGMNPSTRPDHAFYGNGHLRIDGVGSIELQGTGQFIPRPLF